MNEHLLSISACAGTVDTNARNNEFRDARRAAARRCARWAPIRAVDRHFFDVEDYISTGDNRKTDWDNFAPRIGFSYDVNADQRTVIFGGYRPLLRPHAVPQRGRGDFASQYR